MMQVYPIRDDKRHLIPAVTHVDGTGRLQTVNEIIMVVIFGISRFYAHTGVPMLFNTLLMRMNQLFQLPGGSIASFVPKWIFWSLTISLCVEFSDFLASGRCSNAQLLLLLPRLIDSLHSQTFAKWKLLFIDGGSNPVIVNGLISSVLDPRCRWLTQDPTQYGVEQNQGFVEADPMNGFFGDLMTEGSLYSIFTVIEFHSMRSLPSINS